MQDLNEIIHPIRNLDHQKCIDTLISMLEFYIEINAKKQGIINNQQLQSINDQSLIAEQKTAIKAHQEQLREKDKIIADKTQEIEASHVTCAELTKTLVQLYAKEIERERNLKW